MNWSQAFTKFLDPYELKARLFPGLLVLLPGIIYFALTFGPKNPLLVTLGSVLATCGGPSLLANFVRTWGQRAQEKLYKKWSAQPSTILLRHRDDQLSDQTTIRYHTLASSKLGIVMPSRAEEEDNPLLADKAYAAAADALRPMTNDKKKFDLLFKELVHYGYNRNAYGSRWVGFVIAIGAGLMTLFNAGVLNIDEPYFQRAHLSPASGFILSISIAMALLWALHFTGQTVKQSGFSYARRLWEALEQVPKKTAGSPRAPRVRKD
ncbi:hypothetical protein [Solimonas marina]|uniref:Uncharacterized protein n=1 Tax=Solimonas marina TaxID=2714601 RepID=A0A970B864_9GAMM|nr:hypothetical protein [Solimonas marina]NKF24410.1 hypothetical protein [Solimonas marina]